MAEEYFTDVELGLLKHAFGVGGVGNLEDKDVKKLVATALHFHSKALTTAKKLFDAQGIHIVDLKRTLETIEGLTARVDASKKKADWFDELNAPLVPDTPRHVGIKDYSALVELIDTANRCVCRSDSGKDLALRVAERVQKEMKA